MGSLVLLYDIKFSNKMAFVYLFLLPAPFSFFLVKSVYLISLCFLQDSMNAKNGVIK